MDTNRGNITAIGTPYSKRWLGYDRDMRRLWIKGQRLHHGVTGIAMAVAGVVLIAHDWKDRTVWFRRGAQVED